MSQYNPEPAAKTSYQTYDIGALIRRSKKPVLRCSSDDETSDAIDPPSEETAEVDLQQDISPEQSDSISSTENLSQVAERLPDAQQNSIVAFYGQRQEQEPDDPYKGCELVRVENGGACTECGFYLVHELDDAGNIRWLYRCAYRELINNEWVYCKHRIREWSWRRSDPSRRGIHPVHKLGLESDQNGGQVLSCLGGPFAKVYRLLARNAIYMNLSLANGSSVAMMEPIWQACHTYHHLKQQAVNKKKLPQELFPKISAASLRAIMVRLGDEEQTRCLQKLCGVRNAVICLDAGSSGSRHIVHFILNYRGTDSHLLTIDVTGESLTGRKYADCALKALRVCQNAQIHILCFIGDGLQAQVNALSGMHADSLQNRTPEFRAVFFMPCFLHKINLIVPHSVSKYKWFAEVVREYHQLTILLRKQAARSELKQLCPLLVKTRWVYLYDVVAFLVKHEAAIRKVVSSANHKRLLTMAPDYQNLFAPLKALVLTLSGRASNLSCVYPSVLECVCAWRDLEFSSNGLLAGDVETTTGRINNLRNYFVCDMTRLVIEGDLGNILMLAYAVSHRGHDEIWTSKHSAEAVAANSKFVCDTSWINYTDLTTLNVIQSASDDDVSDNDVPEPDILTTQMNSDEIQTSAVTGEKALQSDISPTCCCRLQERKVNIYGIALAGVDDWMTKYMKVEDPSAIAVTKKQLFDWLELPPSCVPFRDLSDYGGIAMWDVIQKTPDAIPDSLCGLDLSKLAELAVTLLSIPASEISCERAFSIHKYIRKDRCGHTNMDLVNARVNVLQSRK